MADHIRIDEGVKRGPKHAHKPPKKRPEGNGQIPADLSPATVIERYLTESTTGQIAYSYGVSRKTLVRWLQTHAPEQWREVQVIRALCRKEDADEQIETACDALSLARAREMLRSGQWDLERLDSKNYAAKQEVAVTIDHQVAVEHSLTIGASELLGRIRQGNAAVLTPVIDVQANPVDDQVID